MNTLARDFYQVEGKSEPIFQSVIFLAESSLEWDDAHKISANLPRGWFELCRLPTQDRIEFVRDFWLNLLPYHPSFHLFLWDFFQKLDDVAVVLVRMAPSGSWAVEMVYSLMDNRSFFRGLVPASESEIDDLKNQITIPLPRDYLSFLRIHNGFGKLSELGLLRSDQVVDARERLTEQFLWTERQLKVGSQIVDPGALIPFYESFGLGSYQCFFNEWFPGNAMGNVYLSGIEYTISDYKDRKGWADQLAFPTFLDWLAFFLEGNSLD